jgi:replicative DNA helicase
MKLLATQAELKAIRTMCGDYEKLSSTLIAATSKESFYYKPAAEAHRVIMERLREKGTTPDWTEIIADPSISEDTRKILKSSKEVPAVSREKVSSIITTLDKYRKLRGIVNLAQFALDNIEDKQVDLDEVIDHISDALVKVRSRGDAKTSLHHFGKGNNTTPLLKEMLYGKQKPSIPTGFRAFDERNGGILLGSLWTIGANTGGGKCLTGDAYISMAEGTSNTIESLWRGSQSSEQPTFNGTEKTFDVPLKLIRRDGKHVDAVGMYKTRGQVMRITLADGKQLTGLPEHKVKVARGEADVWVCLKDLTLDDEVLTV